MRKLLFALVVAAPLVCPSFAARGRSVAPAGLRFAGQAQAAQSPDLAEAERVTREVVRLYNEGKFAEALPDAERAVELREKSLGPDSVPVARSLFNVAAILNQLGKYEGARDAYARSLSILESKVGPDDTLTNEVRSGLGGVYFKLRDYKKAQTLLEAALSSREKTLGPDDAQVAQTLVDLAYVYMVQRDAAKRDATYKRLLDLAGRKPDPTLKIASKAFTDYACTGAVHPDATVDQKEIERRITELWNAEHQAAAAGKTVSGGVLNGKAISKPQPGYPVNARNQRVEGSVIIRVVVDETGKVIEAEPVCGPRELQSAGTEAAKQWKFTPTLLDGVPVKVTGTITFNFVLR